MKRAIEILLIITLLMPMLHDLQSVEDSVYIVADGGQYLDEPTDGAEWQAPPKTLSLTILLKATSVLDREGQVSAPFAPKANHTLRIIPT